MKLIIKMKDMTMKVFDATDDFTVEQTKDSLIISGVIPEFAVKSDKNGNGIIEEAIDNLHDTEDDIINTAINNLREDAVVKHLEDRLSNLLPEGGFDKILSSMKEFILSATTERCRHNRIKNIRMYFCSALFTASGYVYMDVLEFIRTSNDKNLFYTENGLRCCGIFDTQVMSNIRRGAKGFEAISRAIGIIV